MPPCGANSTLVVSTDMFVNVFITDLYTTLEFTSNTLTLGSDTVIQSGLISTNGPNDGSGGIRTDENSLRLTGDIYVENGVFSLYSSSAGISGNINVMQGTLVLNFSQCLAEGGYADFFFNFYLKQYLKLFF